MGQVSRVKGWLVILFHSFESMKGTEITVIIRWWKGSIWVTRTPSSHVYGKCKVCCTSQEGDCTIFGRCIAPLRPAEEVEDLMQVPVPPPKMPSRTSEFVWACVLDENRDCAIWEKSLLAFMFILVSSKSCPDSILLTSPKILLYFSMKSRTTFQKNSFRPFCISLPSLPTFSRSVCFSLHSSTPHDILSHLTHLHEAFIQVFPVGERQSKLLVVSS